MERYTFLKVLALTLVALVIGIMVLPGHPPEEGRNMPWQVETDGQGGSTVFGITLGVTTIHELQERVQEQAEVTLFVAPDGDKSLEVYFQRSRLGGLSAKLVLTTVLDQETLAEMYARGLRVSTQGDGTRKVTLAHEDLLRVQQAAIGSISYLPALNLDPALVEKRFGKPARRIVDKKAKATHWLYPEMGLDLLMSDEAKELLQYVRPGDFERLLAAPLRESLAEE